LPDSKKKTPNKSWVFSFCPRQTPTLPRRPGQVRMYLARFAGERRQWRMQSRRRTPGGAPYRATRQPVCCAPGIGRSRAPLLQEHGREEEEQIARELIQ